MPSMWRFRNRRAALCRAETQELPVCTPFLAGQTAARRGAPAGSPAGDFGGTRRCHPTRLLPSLVLSSSTWRASTPSESIKNRYRSTPPAGSPPHRLPEAARSGPDPHRAPETNPSRNEPKGCSGWAWYGAAAPQHSKKVSGTSATQAPERSRGPGSRGQERRLVQGVIHA